MELTFLGHQGWAFRGNRGGFVLLDPLIGSMGRGRIRLDVWPSRRVVPKKLPVIDGILLSHEHSDHFDIESIWALPYRGTIHISAFSSTAMESALTSMGFRVQRLQAYESIAFGSLRVTPLPVAYMRTESDVLGFLVNDSEGSFLTSVDAFLDDGVDEWLADFFPRRSVDNYTNNAVYQGGGLSDDNLFFPNLQRDFLRFVADHLISFVDRFSPSTTLISGLGWSYPAHLEHFNRIHFKADCETLKNIGAMLYPDLRFNAPLPGDSYRLKGLECRSIGKAAYVALNKAVPRRWNCIDDLSCSNEVPFGNRRELAEAELKKLLRFVESDFGRLVTAHAPAFAEGVQRLSCLRKQRYNDFALRIRNLDQTYDFRFSPSHRSFRKARSIKNLQSRSAVGCEFWASDLLDIVNCDEDPFVVYETAARRWNSFPELFREDIFVDLFHCFASEHMPEKWSESYSRRIGRLGPRLE